MAFLPEEQCEPSAVFHQLTNSWLQYEQRVDSFELLVVILSEIGCCTRLLTSQNITIFGFHCTRALG